MSKRKNRPSRLNNCGVEGGDSTPIHPSRYTRELFGDHRLYCNRLLLVRTASIGHSLDLYTVEDEKNTSHWRGTVY